MSDFFFEMTRIVEVMNPVAMDNKILQPAGVINLIAEFDKTNNCLLRVV